MRRMPRPARSVQTTGGVLKMRDLERLTGVNRETIRVYFRQGLLPEPLRPKRNVAHYTDVHVRAILSIRNLHHSSRMPLQQIRRAMDGDATAMPSDAGSFADLESLVVAQMDAGDALVPLSRLEDQTPGVSRDVRAFSKVGAISVIRRKGEALVSHTDARLLALWQQMRDAGFSEANGFSPEVVDMYVQAAQSLAHVEVKRFLSIIRGRMDEPHAAELALTAIRVMIEFFGLLRMKAVLVEMKSQTVAARPGSRPRG
jgi:DNA-binding transcriptional MerR regulator